MAGFSRLSLLCAIAIFFFSQSSLATSRRQELEPVDGSIVAQAVVAFHQPRLQEAEKLLNEISDPSSKQFGSYLDAKQLRDLFAPAADSVAAVEQWLKQGNVSTDSMRLRKTSSTLEFNATIDQLEALFSTAHYFALHPETQEVQLHHEEYAIPAHLQGHVEFATVSNVDLPKSDLRKRQSLSVGVTSGGRPAYKIAPGPHHVQNCSESWTPACIRELYGIPSRDPKTPVPSNNSIGIYGFGDIYNQTDLNSFFQQFAPEIPIGTEPDMQYINGAEQYATYISGEESLDIQMSYPIIHPQNLTIFQTPYNIKGGIVNDFLDAVDASYCDKDGGDDPDFDPQYPAFQGFQGPRMCGTLNVTNVVSISFATDEAGLSKHYVQRQCNEWMKLALAGVTVLAAAGDRGVSGNFGCAVNPSNSSSSAFSPLFPASCPYVTAVGAMQVDVVGDVWEQVAIDDPKHNFWGGGGFSSIESRPSYQSKAVDSYLSAHDPKYPNGTFNHAGRGYPDVAVLGASVTIIDQGENTVSGGTSAATPLFAGMINRINDERILAGKKPIGFLNQILYQHPEVFTDIVKGSNPGCGTKGFETAKGWDPVTGLGSPVFPKLRDLLFNLP